MISLGPNSFSSCRVEAEKRTPCSLLPPFIPACTSVPHPRPPCPSPSLQVLWWERYREAQQMGFLEGQAAGPCTRQTLTQTGPKPCSPRSTCISPYVLPTTIPCFPALMQGTPGQDKVSHTAHTPPTIASYQGHSSSQFQPGSSIQPTDTRDGLCPWPAGLEPIVAV